MLFIVLNTEDRIDEQCKNKLSYRQRYLKFPIIKYDFKYLYKQIKLNYTFW